MQRLRGSIALRGWRGTFARVRQEFEARPVLDESLDVEPLDVAFVPFVVPSSVNPRVSIVIPVYGKLEYTLACLRSIARHAPTAPFELIVVDDASPDGSVATLRKLDGVRIIVNKKNLGFIGSCNAGAAAATGEYLLFLNNDTQVTAGWLDQLLGCFYERGDCGIAGSRLVYPDGRLQEAGGLVFNDGTCWNVGRFESRDAPAFRFRREVDYVSGASLMIRRDMFAKVGGFDKRYAPAYYEDTDLGFAVRDAGMRVYYEPASVVVHYEGISSGTDIESGAKRYQAINQTTFAAKWAEVLKSHPARSVSADRATRWRSRGRVLVVDTVTPEPARDSGSLRLSAILRLLGEQGWSCCFLPDDGRATANEIAALGALGAEVLAKPCVTGLASWLAENGSDLHAVMLCRHNVAGQYIDLVRRHAPQAILLFDTVDLHFVREQRAAELNGSASMARQAQASRQSELSLIESCDVSLVVSADEQELLKELVPQARVELLSNIHEIHGQRRPHNERRDLVFIGGHGHPPNVDAMRWIASDILPSLHQVSPETQVHVLGDVPDNLRTELSTPGLVFHGRVADLAPWLDGCLASLAPLRFGAGVKGKINMSMSYGMPVIATTMAVEGMHLTDGDDVLIADEPQAFAQAFLRLQRDPSIWQRISEHGIENIRKHFSVEAAAAALRRILP